MAKTLIRSSLRSFQSKYGNAVQTPDSGTKKGSVPRGRSTKKMPKPMPPSVMSTPDSPT